MYSTQTDSLPTLLHVPGKFFIGLDEIAIQLGYMDKAPDYTKEEKLAYKAAKRDHEICEKLGIENYVFRLVKLDNQYWHPIYLNSYFPMVK